MSSGKLFATVQISHSQLRVNVYHGLNRDFVCLHEIKGGAEKTVKTKMVHAKMIMIPLNEKESKDMLFIFLKLSSYDCHCLLPFQKYLY